MCHTDPKTCSAFSTVARLRGAPPQDRSSSDERSKFMDRHLLRVPRPRHDTSRHTHTRDDRSKKKITAHRCDVPARRCDRAERARVQACRSPVRARAKDTHAPRQSAHRYTRSHGDGERRYMQCVPPARRRGWWGGSSDRGRSRLPRTTRSPPSDARATGARSPPLHLARATRVAHLFVGVLRASLPAPIGARTKLCFRLGLRLFIWRATLRTSFFSELGSTQ